MTFDESLVQVRELLEREGRVAYRILKRRFALTDDDLDLTLRDRGENGVVSPV